MGRLSLRRQIGREHLEGLFYFDLGHLLNSRALQKDRKRADVVGSEDDIDPRRLLHDGSTILLRETAANSNLHIGVLPLQRRQVGQVAVKPVIGVLSDGTRVEDDDVGVLAVGDRHQPGILQ